MYNENPCKWDITMYGHENINIAKDIWNNVGSLASSLLNKFMTTQNVSSSIQMGKSFRLTRRGLCYIFMFLYILYFQHGNNEIIVHVLSHYTKHKCFYKTV